MKSLAAGLLILLKYAPDGAFGAGHYLVWSCPIPDKTISDADQKELQRLGWYFDEQFNSWNMKGQDTLWNA